MFQENKREVVAFLIDTNPIAWKKLADRGDLSFKEFLDELFSYFTQMILTDIFQAPPILAYNQLGCEWLFPAPENTKSLVNGDIQLTNSDEVFVYYNVVIENLTKFSEKTAQMKMKSGTGVRLDLVFSKALCLLNKFPNEMPKRIFTISVSEDSQENFESTINAIFAAHRIGVVIDSFLINPAKDSLFLNQAALITGGFSLSIKFRIKLLAQYLLSIPPLPIRDLVALKKVQNINYKTPAENTQNMIDVGLLCPVCLSVFEKTENRLRICPICKTRSLL